MKIAFIGQKGIPAIWGGVEYHVDRLSRGLVKRGHEVFVYARSWYTKKKIKEYEGVKLIYMPTIKTKHLDASLHSLLSSIHAISQKYEIIHYHAIGPSSFAFLPKLSGLKIVSTIHRLDWQAEKWGKLAKILMKIGEKIAIKIAEKVIVVSEDLWNYFYHKYGLKTVLIPNGIDEPKIREVDLINQKYNLRGRDYILFMGRLSPEKRVDWLISSFQELKKRNLKMRNIKLVIAGGESIATSYIKRLKKMSQDDPAIIFTGFVSGVEKEELLSNALIFVLPSQIEGLPIAVLEAKSYGQCCLASDIPPHKEVIKVNFDGLLFKSTDRNDLTEKLQMLIEDEEKIYLLREGALKEAKKRPSWSEMVEKVEQVYKNIIN